MSLITQVLTAAIGDEMGYANILKKEEMAGYEPLKTRMRAEEDQLVKQKLLFLAAEGETLIYMVLSELKEKTRSHVANN